MSQIHISGAEGFSIGAPSELAIICGPCVIESREHALFMAKSIKSICDRLGLPLVYKSSYDKANRTSASSFRGMGLDEGLKILREVRETFKIPVITDVHTEEEAEVAGLHVDILQIPAFLCRQTDLLLAAGRSAKTVLIKKGQFLHPADMAFAAEKVKQAGGADVLLCERGACFGYRELIVDFRSLGIMRELGYPVVFDATHSVQVMGGSNGKSGGARKWVPPLARAAVAFGVDAVFLECHQEPEQAPSDGPNMIPLGELEALLVQLKQIREALA